MITLELIERYGTEGWQDPSDGVVYYDDEFMTPYGPLGNISVEKVDDEWVIRQADDVVLFGRGFIDSILAGIEDECTQVGPSLYGFATASIHASNGDLMYQLHDDLLTWSDTGKEAPCYLATLMFKDWHELV